MKKKLLSVLMIVMLTACLLAGCGGSGTDDSGGYEIDYYIYTCRNEQCKISIREESYLIDDNIGHCKITVYDDGVLIDTIEYDIYYSDMGGSGGQ